MATLVEQINELKHQLELERNTAAIQNERINDLMTQMTERIENSPMYQKQLESMEMDRYKVEKLTAENEQLKKDLERISAERDKLKEIISEQITERYMSISNPPKRGAKRKADTEKRQYIHELRKCGNSLSVIARLTGMSKTQVHSILKEPEYLGKWYTNNASGEAIYYDTYAEAVRSKEIIHFKPDVQSPP